MQWIEVATKARAAGDLRRARRAADRAAARDPSLPAAWRLVAQVAADQGRIDDAITAYQTASQFQGIDAVAASLHGGRLCLKAGDAARAETLWRRCLELKPDQVDASSELAYLLGVEGRGWEMQGPLTNVIRGGEPTVHHLVLMCVSEPVIKDTDLVSRCLKRVPGDLNVTTGQARTDLFEGRTEPALAALRKVCQSKTVTAEAQARLGWALLELHPEQMTEWRSGLSTMEHPELFAVEGAWSLRSKDLSRAARAFAQAVRMDPDHRMANYQLGTTLSQMGRTPEAQPFLDRASKLQQLALMGDRIYAHPRETFQHRQAMELTAALGRPYEAWGWCHIALQINPNLEWARRDSAKLAPWLTSTAPRVIPESLPTIPVDLLRTDSSSPQIAADATRVSRGAVVRSPRFENVAERIGLAFSFEAGSRNRSDGVDLIEFTGGGVAAFDFDRDMRCDLYFPQGRAIPFSRVQTPPPDKLYRQTGDGLVEDITDPAGLGDTDYSQGCTTGDFDQDGFLDLYLCNVGRNRLYHNNGDGTFADITEASGLQGTGWTVSALSADLNGDGLPELFDVNYLDINPKDIPFCPRGSEDTHCSPTARPPSPDRLWLNLGDGTFREVSRQAGLLPEKETGRGLGIVAADLNGDARLDLFIANDAEPNFLYFGQPMAEPTPGEIRVPQFDESGVVAGVAYDRDGLAQACMGVAIADADDNGLLDLYITNYADQSNTLYLQLEPGIFHDSTREAGLREPSFSLLGFGAQWLDADLDGHQDLVLTNGHVYDMTYGGKQYAMRPQFFSGVGRGRFVEQFRESAGEFFGGAYVGRGLARLDWNRDGLPDIAISHIGSPAALLVNRTQSPGNHLSLSFSGTVSERDAIGTIVRVKTDGGKSVHHLTGGDGYEARNEALLMIGVGAQTTSVRLEVQWPSGLKQTFDDVAVNGHYHLVEGRQHPIAKPQSD